MYKPLADEIRPHSLDDVVGQKHILGERGLLRRIVESGSIPNMIFYGPSGTGKTTVARIIAEKTNRTLRKLNATTAGLADIKEIIAELDTLLTPGGVLLYLDEIQYFNKKAAAIAAGVYRGRAHHAHRLDDGKPVFLRVRRYPQPLDGVRVQARHAQGGRACRYARVFHPRRARG